MMRHVEQRNLASTESHVEWWKLFFCTDPVHVDNHTRCLESYSSTEYRSLHALNKEACEQFNSVLRGIASTVAFMTFDHYMLAIKIFIYFHNLD